MRIPIPVKLCVAFGLVITATTVVSFASLNGVARIHDTTVNKLRDDTIPGLDQMGRIAYLFARVRGDFWRQAFFEDPARRQALRAQMNEQRTLLEKAFTGYEASITRDEDRELFATLQSHMTTYFTILEAAQAHLDAKERDAFTAKAGELATFFSEQVAPHVFLMLEKNSQWAKEACANNIAIAEEVEHSTKIGMIASIFISVLAAGMLSWSILPRLSACRRSIDAMSGGSLDDGMTDARRSRLASGGDELGDIARSVVSLRGYMSTMSTSATAIASGNLRDEVMARGSQDVLGNAFKTMRDNLRGNIDSITRSAQALAGAAEELSASSAQLDSSSGEASARAQSAAAATEEVNRGIQGVASAAEEMSTSVKEISAQTQSMAGKVSQTAEAAQKMVEATKSVDEIATTIAGIAEQTNLLALNATIEAARAGEAGRGFAVVAGEVKALASQTAEATRNITRILSELRVQAQTVGSGTAEVRDATGAVASAVEEQNATTTEIGRNMSEAARGSQEIASGVTAAATAAGDAKQGAAQVREAADSLARIATELQQTVAGFRI
ncbi:MAG: methyl-accepting chemotaxis protein [Planctomycetes bacterium]|nr:methyl-accepting chemotaxis protein [Planctomycetota bacterium]